MSEVFVVLSLLLLLPLLLHIIEYIIIFNANINLIIRHKGKRPTTSARIAHNFGAFSTLYLYRIANSVRRTLCVVVV